MIMIVCSSCMFFTDDDDDDDDSLVIPSGQVVSRIDFKDTEADKKIEIRDLSNQSVYLVKSNNSPYGADKAGTGSVVSTYVSSYRVASSADEPVISNRPVSGVFSTPEGLVTRIDHEDARDLMANPPPFTGSSSSRGARATGVVAKIEDRNVGAKTNFFVECNLPSKDTDGTVDGWYDCPATLCAKGAHCNVWISDSNYTASETLAGDNLLTVTQAVAIADTFDKIYPLVTNVFGFEYGGEDGSGGVDGYTRINIFLYDADYDYSAIQTSGIVGYFYPKDYYSILSQPYSNQTEMFYMDVHFTDQYPGVMYSTLVHEFQHMIDWNEKYVKNGTLTSTWYNEMLSQVAEDMMSSHLESFLGESYNAGTDGPIASRMPYFNYGYDFSGVTDWISGSNVNFSYASAYAFGAYLARNYRGAALIKAIARNSSVDTVSISDALSSLGCAEKSFSAAFARYHEALVFSGSGFSDGKVPSSVNTFDRSVTTIVGNYSYTFPAFDIWKMTYVYDDYGNMYTGPWPYQISETSDLRPYGVSLYSDNSWLHVAGDLSLTVKKPANTNVSLYLLVRDE